MFYKGVEFSIVGTIATFYVAEQVVATLLWTDEKYATCANAIDFVETLLEDSEVVFAIENAKVIKVGSAAFVVQVERKNIVTTYTAANSIRGAIAIAIGQASIDLSSVNTKHLFYPKALKELLAWTGHSDDCIFMLDLAQSCNCGFGKALAEFESLWKDLVFAMAKLSDLANHSRTCAQNICRLSNCDCGLDNARSFAQVIVTMGEL